MDQAKRVAVFSAKNHDKAYLSKALEQLKSNIEFIFFETALKLETASLCQGYDAICAFVHDDLSEPVLKKISDYGVKIVALRSSGYNHIDMDAAKFFGIKVVRVPSYSPHAIAEYAVCLLLTLNRKLKKSILRTSEGNFQLDGLLGFDIFGKTVGVIGTGKTGVCFIKIMLGFGAKILCYAPTENPEVLNLGIKYSTFDEVISNSDIISLHLHLNKDTYHLINKETIQKMKKGAYLINVSKGALIDTEAAIEGLKSGQIGGLGNDVVENEENIFHHNNSDEVIQDDQITRLMASNNVLLTGHQAFFTVEALTNIANTTVTNLTQVFNGETCPNCVETIIKRKLSKGSLVN